VQRLDVFPCCLVRPGSEGEREGGELLRFEKGEVGTR